MKWIDLAALSAVGVIGLAACSIPGASRTSVQYRAPVVVAGQTCEFVERRTETNTINGIHSYVAGEITCGRQTYSCDDETPESCGAAIAARIRST